MNSMIECNLALHGLAGDFVRAVEPHTESDPAALLFQFLTAFGNCVGRHSFVVADSTKHFPNLFVVLVGKSAKGRKGTSWGHVANLFEEIEPDWFQKCKVSGLTSGEGLIASVRDLPDGESQPEPPGWNVTKERLSDKRRLVVESEFAGVLRVLQREGNKLSPVIRDSWDGTQLSILTKADPALATGAHISIVGHITEAELKKYLSDTEVFNGFGNRFLWVGTARSKLLPFGGQLDKVTMEDLKARLRNAIRFANADREIEFEVDARDFWTAVYEELSIEQPGLFGTMVARSEPMVLRLAMIYALLDLSKCISKAHLTAALAAWKYCESTCRRIFETSMANPLGDRIVEALKTKPNGLTQTDINVSVFHRNRSSSQIRDSLDRLETNGVVRKEETVVLDGHLPRVTTRWFAVPKMNELNELNEFKNGSALMPS